MRAPVRTDAAATAQDCCYSTAGRVPVLGDPRAAQASSCSKGAPLQLQLIGHAACEGWPGRNGCSQTHPGLNGQHRCLTAAAADGNPSCEGWPWSRYCGQAAWLQHSVCTQPPYTLCAPTCNPADTDWASANLGREVLVCRLLRYGDPGPPIWPLSSLHGLLICNCCGCAALLVHVCHC